MVSEAFTSSKSFVEFNDSASLGRNMRCSYYQRHVLIFLSKKISFIFEITAPKKYTKRTNYVFSASQCTGLLSIYKIQMKKFGINKLYHKNRYNVRHFNTTSITVKTIISSLILPLFYFNI